MVRDNYMKKHKNAPKKWGDIIESARAKAAKEYAINMTVALHFDYSKFSKSKVMREGPGAMVFQFQHYGFKFFERNMEYMRKAKNDIVTGDPFGTNAWRAYRMGLVYFAAPVFAAALTGLNIGSIMEHDTVSRVENLSTAFMGTEEEKQ